jgi:hypothetical protein
MDCEMARHSGTVATIDYFYSHRLKRSFRTCRSLPPRLRARGCRDKRGEGASGAGGRGRALLHAPPRLHARRGWGIAAGRCCTHPPCLRARACRDRGRIVACPHASCNPPTRLRTRRCRGRGRVVKCPHAFACEGVSVSRLGCTPTRLRARGCRGEVAADRPLSRTSPARLRARGASGGESRVEHPTVLATPPILRAPAVRGRDFEADSEAVVAPQPRMVRAMCKANWPAQKNLTKPQRGSPPEDSTEDEAALTSPRAPGVRVEGG